MRETSRKAAAAAGRTLRSKKASKAARTAAASALAQTEKPMVKVCYMACVRATRQNDWAPCADTARRQRRDSVDGFTRRYGPYSTAARKGLAKIIVLYAQV
jgi:hypothetical protein